MLVAVFASHVAVTVAAKAGAAHASNRMTSKAVAPERPSDGRVNVQQALRFDRDCKLV
jgi:hypothetical protein